MDVLFGIEKANPIGRELPNTFIDSKSHNDTKALSRQKELLHVWIKLEILMTKIQILGMIGFVNQGKSSYIRLISVFHKIWIY